MSKKGAKATPKEVSSYETRDVVLGKVRGFPPWPGMVVDPDSVPEGVAKERPGSKKATFYCVQFFPTGDYAWLVSKDISKLQTHEIESYINEPYKKSGDLLAGYRIALDPKKWEEDREMATHEAVEAEANAEIDQLESENEDTKKQTKSKKRKRESDAASVPSAKVKKAPKPKKEPTEQKPKKQTGGAKSRKNGTSKSKAMVESEDEGEDGAAGAGEDEDVGPSKKASPPPTKKTKRDKDEDGDEAKLAEDPEAIKVREWRHRLQKAFLGKSIPKEEEIPNLDALFTTVETYDKITVQYLQFSKIGKVMRHIAILPDEKVPGDTELKFRERAKALVDKWHQVLNANKPNGSDGGATNGTVAATLPTNKGEDDKSKEDNVTEATAAINLNGNGSAGPDPGDAPMVSADADAEAEAEVEGEGDMSVLADVTMSEAGA